MKLFKWNVKYAKCVDTFDVPTVIIASNFFRAMQFLYENYDKKFLDNYLLEIKFDGKL